MKLINCGTGPFVVLEEVVCENCGPRYWNEFDEDTARNRHYFPLICRTEFVRSQGSCICGGQVRCATRPFDYGEEIPYSEYYDIPFSDGEVIRIYEVIEKEPA